MATRLIWALTVLLFTFCSIGIHAQQQAQFENLSPAQQRMLAAQYGVNLPDSNVKSTLQQPSTIINERIDNRSEQPDLNQNIHFSRYVDQYLDIEENTLKPYGYDLFSGQPSTFAPVSDAPVPANYVIGVGDTVQLNIFGKKNAQHQLVVDRSGNLFIPEIGPVNVVGKSFNELKEYLATEIKRQVIGVNVAVSLGELRSMRIFVAGEAYKPGAYMVSSLATITQALFVSGGVTDIASLRRIQLKRAGKLVSELDLYDLLMRGDSSKDVLLQPGDVVFVPSISKTVTIKGEVVRPAIYELKGEKSIASAIELAGGLKANAYSKAISVTRQQQGRQIQVTVNAQDTKARVVNGDQISVSSSSEDTDNSVLLVGAAVRPGSYQWKQGLMLSDLVQPSTALLREADRSYLLILRLATANNDIEIIQKNLTLNQSIWDESLQVGDKVIVFSTFESKSSFDNQIDELAFTKSDLQDRDKLRWKRKIEESLFWKELGIAPNEREDSVFSIASDDETELSNVDSLIELSEAERKKLTEMADAHPYSRKRLLDPIIRKLTEQASFGEPLKLVEVSGAVKVPGLYPIANNADFKQMISAAGGLSEMALAGKAEITRIGFDDGKLRIEHLNINPQQAMSSEAPVLVQSKDRINVFQTNIWQQEQKVTVKGEVAFPGVYTISKGETLAQLIARVGGATEFGDLSASVFTRERIRRLEQRNLQKLTQELRKELASNSLTSKSNTPRASYSELKLLLKDLTSVRATGRLVVDVPEVVSGDLESDLLLEPGDTLYVPRKSYAVNVLGEVFVPTSHVFDRDLDVAGYIEKSGGYKELAAEEKVYIIRANGSVTLAGKNDSFWYSSNDQGQLLKPGDTIVVPLNTEYMDNMSLWKNSTQIVYQLAVTLAAIKGL